MISNWDKRNELPICPECGLRFKDMFEAIEHFLEDDEEFDPAMLLPGGYRLMLGSLLQAIYEHRNDPTFISEITQSTYATLFTAEVQPELINETVEDIIVETEMEDFDVQLKNLFKNGE